MLSKLLRHHCAYTKVTAEWTQAGNQWWWVNNVIYFALRAGAFQALHLSTWEQVCMCGVYVVHALTHMDASHCTAS